jgi:hypothetical protein
MRTRVAVCVFVSAAVVIVPVWVLKNEAPPPGPAQSTIVQADRLASARAAVRAVGGTVTHELAVINAVAAWVTPRQRETLRELGLLLHPNQRLELATVSGGPTSTSGTTP